MSAATPPTRHGTPALGGNAVQERLWEPPPRDAAVRSDVLAANRAAGVDARVALARLLPASMREEAAAKLAAATYGDHVLPLEESSIAGRAIGNAFAR